MTIRPEQADDIAGVRAINEAAFGEPTEATIVDSLRDTCSDAVFLVAEEDGRILGHICFSPAFVSGGHGATQGMGLAPMAELPERQRQGIGSILVQARIDAMRERNCPFIIVLGHPEYYPRFGFVPASQHDLSCPWDGVPDEAFMVLVLNDDAMAGVSGLARYRNEFDQAMLEPNQALHAIGGAAGA